MRDRVHVFHVTAGIHRLPSILGPSIGLLSLDHTIYHVPLMWALCSRRSFGLVDESHGHLIDVDRHISVLILVQNVDVRILHHGCLGSYLLLVLRYVRILVLN